MVFSVVWWSVADELHGGFVDLESGEAFGQPDDDDDESNDSDDDDDDAGDDGEDSSASDKGVYCMLQNFVLTSFALCGLVV